MDIGGLMTKQEIKKAIEKGKSVWVVYNTFLPYTLVMEENLTKEYSVEPYYQKEQKWALWLKNRYICDIDRVYKTKAEANHYLNHANISRTTYLPFLTWEEFKKKKIFRFVSASGTDCFMQLIENKQLLFYYGRGKVESATEENFYKLYDDCVKCFMGEV